MAKLALWREAMKILDDMEEKIELERGSQDYDTMMMFRREIKKDRFRGTIEDMNNWIESVKRFVRQVEDRKMAEKYDNYGGAAGAGRDKVSDLKYLSQISNKHVWFPIDNRETLYENCFEDKRMAENSTRRLFDPLEGHRWLQYERFPNILIGFKFVDGVDVAKAIVPKDLKDGDILVTSTKNQTRSYGHMCVTVIQDGKVDMFDPNGPNMSLEIWKKAVAAAAGLPYKTQAESRFRQNPQALIEEDYIEEEDRGDAWATLRAKENNGMCQIISAMKIWSMVTDGDKMESLTDPDSLNEYYTQFRSTKEVAEIFGDRTSIQLSTTDAIQEWMTDLYAKLGLPLVEGSWPRRNLIQGPLVTSALDGTDPEKRMLPEDCTVYPESRYGPTNLYRASACITRSMYDALYKFMDDGIDEAVAILPQIQLLLDRKHTLPIICLESEKVIRTPVVGSLLPLPTSFHVRLVQVFEKIREMHGLEESVEAMVENARFRLMVEYNNDALEEPGAQGSSRYTDTRVARVFL